MGTSRLPDLNNLRYLVEVADSGSFSAAARLFGVPPSLVSRRIARLEAEVGARLFQRTTRSLKLTDAGEAFLGHARVAMQSVLLAHESLGEAQGVLSGRVRLSAPIGVGGLIWPVVSDFLSRHAGVTVALNVADRFVDLIEERFDIAVRSAPQTSGGNLIGRQLLDAPKQLFASPDYLKRRGTPRTIADLKDHDCVILGTQVARTSWQIQQGSRTRNVVVQGRVALNEATLVAQCAADGHGIAFLPRMVCLGHVEAGRLQRILPKCDAGPRGLWLVYPDRHLPPASRALAEFLVSELPRVAAANAR